MRSFLIPSSLAFSICIFVSYAALTANPVGSIVTNNAKSVIRDNALILIFFIYIFLSA